MPGVEDRLVHGREQIIRNLQAFPEELRQKALVRGVMAGGRVIRDDARARVRVRTGHLQKSIVVQRRRTEHKFDISVSIGIKPKTAARKYAHLEEFGRSATTVKSTGMKVGPTKPNPFLRPAADSNDAAVLEAVFGAVDKFMRKQGVPA